MNSNQVISIFHFHQSFSNLVVGHTGHGILQLFELNEGLAHFRHHCHVAEKEASRDSRMAGRTHVLTRNSQLRTFHRYDSLNRSELRQRVDQKSMGAAIRNGASMNNARRGRVVRVKRTLNTLILPLFLQFDTLLLTPVRVTAYSISWQGVLFCHDPAPKSTSTCPDSV